MYKGEQVTVAALYLEENFIAGIMSGLLFVKVH